LVDYIEIVQLVFPVSESLHLTKKVKVTILAEHEATAHLFSTQDWVCTEEMFTLYYVPSCLLVCFVISTFKTYSL